MTQNIDIAALLTEALLSMGCDPELIGTLDAHNDIVLDFQDMPSIHLMRDGDDIRIWAGLGERHDYKPLIDAHAPQMLLELMQPQSYACGGSLAMSIQEETLQLTALLNGDALADSEKFSDALNAFFGRVGVFNHLVSE